MLVIASRDNDGLYAHCVQTRGGSCGACADGVVNIQNAVKLSHVLKPVLDACKMFRDKGTDLIADHALGSGKGGKIIEHIVLARKSYKLCRNQRVGNPVPHTADHSVFDSGAVRDVVFIREVGDAPLGK